MFKHESAAFALFKVISNQIKFLNDIELKCKAIWYLFV